MNRSPDFSQIQRVFEKKAPERPTLFEFFLNDALYAHVAGRLPEVGDGFDVLRRRIKAFDRIGYDYVTLSGNAFGFPARTVEHKHTYSINQGGVISDRASFEAYPWGDPEDQGTRPLDVAAACIPEGMKLIVQGPGGLLENTIKLVGYEDLCYLMRDDPNLVSDITSCIGERLVRYYDLFIGHPDVGAIISNDDWGFNHQTMIPPDDLRRWVFPWHRKIVALAHAHGKPALLHSCGYAGEIMEDIIAMGFDAKHSFEDKIQPIEDAYEAYAGRIALLGGLDVDFVCRAEPSAIARRSLDMVERTRTRGGWALGTGNSVPDYIPWDHYFAMVGAATGLTYDQVMAR